MREQRERVKAQSSVHRRARCVNVASYANGHRCKVWPRLASTLRCSHELSTAHHRGTNYSSGPHRHGCSRTNITRKANLAQVGSAQGADAHSARGDRLNRHAPGCAHRRGDGRRCIRASLVRLYRPGTITAWADGWAVEPHRFPAAQAATATANSRHGATANPRAGTTIHRIPTWTQSQTSVQRLCRRLCEPIRT